MKKVSFQLSLVRSLLGTLIFTICSQNVSARQVSQNEHLLEEENTRNTLTAPSRKLSAPFIEGPNFVCQSAVFRVKNTVGSYEWSCNQPNVLSIDKDGVVKLKKGFGGLVTIRAKLKDADTVTGYIDKTIEVAAHFDESDIVVSGDSILHETGNGNDLYQINLSVKKEGNQHDISAGQFELGIKYPGEDFVHAISQSNEASVSGDLVIKTIGDYFKPTDVPGRVELVGRVQTRCGWSGWSQPLFVKTPQKTAYKVYPNPAREKITIDFENELPDQVAIYSESSMKEVRTIRLNDRGLSGTYHPRKIDIQVADLTPGVYFLHLKSNEGVKILSVLLE